MSTTLAIDTAGMTFAVALVVDGDIVREVQGAAPLDHTRLLLPALHELLGADAARVDRLAVARGPGGYAGVRVGLAVAAGYAMARSLPLVGIGTLEAVAMVAGPGSWLAIHPAGRGTFAAQAYTDGIASGPLHALAEQEVRGDRLAGEGAAPFGGREVTAAERCRAVAALALLRFASARPGPPDALYLREPNITAPRARQSFATPVSGQLVTPTKET